MTVGKFIVVEGLEGAGKSSVLSAIRTDLESKDIDCIETREPGGTPLAESIRSLIKQHWQESVSIETELMMMYAARSQLLENRILPALKRGTWVIGDRHDLSSRAYQGGGRGVSESLITSIRAVTLKGFEPDLTIYLDVEPSIGLARARGRGELDRIETSGLAFFERVRETYRQLACDDPKIVIIDAMQTAEKVRSDVVACIARFVGS